MDEKVKCKREGCPNEMLPYRTYDGCCSLYCRDVHELDVEMDAMRLVLETQKEQNKRLQSKLENSAGKMKPEYIWADFGKGEIFIEANAIQHLVDVDILIPMPFREGEKNLITLVVNCNDIFYWGCADFELIGYDEVRELYELCFDRECKQKTWGSVVWVCRRRKMRPQHPIEEDMKKGGYWTDELEALPVRDFTG